MHSDEWRCRLNAAINGEVDGLMDKLAETSDGTAAAKLVEIGQYLREAADDMIDVGRTHQIHALTLHRT